MKKTLVLAFSLVTLVLIFGIASVVINSHQKGLNFLNGRDYRYEIVNDTDQSVSLVSLSEYKDGFAIGSEWSFDSGESRGDFYAECLFVIDENNQEVRSFKGDNDMDVILQLEEGEQRVIYLSESREGCPVRLADVEHCALGLKNEFHPIEECFE